MSAFIDDSDRIQVFQSKLDQLIVTRPDPSDLLNYDAISSEDTFSQNLEEAVIQNVGDIADIIVPVDNLNDQNYIYSGEKIEEYLYEIDQPLNGGIKKKSPIFGENGEIKDVDKYNELYTFAQKKPTEVIPDIKLDRIDIFEDNSDDSLEQILEEEGNDYYDETSGVISDVKELSNLYNDLNEESTNEKYAIDQEINIDAYEFSLQTPEVSNNPYNAGYIKQNKQYIPFSTEIPAQYHSKEIEKHVPNYPSSTPIPIQYNNPSFYSVRGYVENKTANTNYIPFSTASTEIPELYKGFSTFSSVHLNEVQYKVVGTPAPTQYKYASTAIPVQFPDPTTAVPVQNPDPTTAVPVQYPDPTTAVPVQNPDPTSAVPVQYPDLTTAVPDQNPDPTTAVPVQNPDPTKAAPVQYPNLTTAPPVPYKDPSSANSVPVHDNDASTVNPVQYKDVSTPSPVQYIVPRTETTEQYNSFGTHSSSGYNIVSFFNTLENEGSNQNSRYFKLLFLNDFFSICRLYFKI